MDSQPSTIPAGYCLIGDAIFLHGHWRVIEAIRREVRWRSVGGAVHLRFRADPRLYPVPAALWVPMLPRRLA